ncbi:MAG: glycoside hydrolase family 99-like domain-containing protein [Planctomycetota bacterium]
MPDQEQPDLRRYFDRRWYVATYGAGRRRIRWWPWHYYRRRGWRKGHAPCQLFDAAWYLDRNPDVRAAGLDPLAHYAGHGWREGRQPHPLFDPSWYAARYADVGAAGVEPLLHYLTVGWREGRQPHPAFDAAGYLEANPDVAAAGLEPLAHYLAYGWREGRQPHPLFDGGWYIDRNPDVALAGLEPLTHFLGTGWRERREPCPSFSLAAYVAARPRPLDAGVNPFVHFLVTEYDPGDRESRAAVAARYASAARPAAVAAAAPAVGPANRGHVRAIAMYLPQFHRVPENDAWWGEGFTEWTNVRRARPMFSGHQQPHVPHRDVGYYDLDDETVLERQAEMARRHGIHGFCFYHYWFDGRRILEKPVERLLASGRPDFPFCLCWANENWTRTWDGLEREVLLGQRHSPDSDERFLRDLLPALRDPRYITVEGLPLVAVYRPGLLAEPRATADRWRQIAEREGLPGLHLAAVHSFDQADPRTYGFDAAIQFPPLQIPAANLRETGLAGMDRRFRGGVLDYREALCHSLARPTPDYPLYRGVMPGWDNTPRRMERATAWVNSSPGLYGRWLRGVVEQMQREQPAERQLVFINAWNEWAEGAHLEPDERHGYAILEETAAVLLPQPAGAQVAAAAATALPRARDRHPTVVGHRRARLRTLFGGDVPEASHAFLLDHVAAVARLAATGHRLTLCDGVPVCQGDTETIPLDDPAALSASLLAADRAGERPFCFVLLQFNQPEVTARCVASLRRLSTVTRRVHVVIVDNGSEPATVARTRELFTGLADVTLLFTGANLGFAKGNNVGYAHARDVLVADFIAVINNDTVVGDPAFVERCLDAFRERPWSVLGPDIVTPDGRHENPWNDHVYEAGEWEALEDLFRRQRAAWQAGGPAEFRRLGSRSPDAPTLCDPILQGAAYVFSPVFTAEHARAFDERTFLYGEEFLLAVDCLLAGHLAVYDPRITIVHEEGVSTARVPERRKLALGYDAVVETAAICRTRLERHEAAARGMWLTPDSPALAVLTGDGRTHVLVDLLFCQPGFHGGGEYGKAVFNALVAAAARRGDVQLWVALDPKLFIDGWVWEACREHAVNVVAVTSYAEITRLVNRGLFGSFFAPAIVVYTGYEYQQRIGGELGLASGPTRVIGTLLDVRDLEMARDWERIATARREAGCRHERSLSPAAWQATRERQQAQARDLLGMYRGICGHAAVDTLVTISAYSAASLRERVGTSRPVEVLFPPAKNRTAPEAFGVPGVEAGRDQFGLVVNAGRIEKNAATAVAAFDRLCSDPGFAAEHPRLKLVLTGIDGLDGLGLEPLANPARFVALPHLPPERLEYLYREARFLLYPSFNEGFGYPPLEAMTYGTPSVVADNTAVPEVLGPAAIPCDPFAPASVMQAIRTVLAAPPTAAELHDQLATVAGRQDADLARLVALVCGPVPALEPVGATRSLLAA